MNKFARYLPALLALLLTGCDQNYTMDCDFVVVPYLQSDKNGRETIAEDIIGYYFYAGTSDYEVASYEQAMAGVLLSKKGLPEKVADGKAIVSGNDGSLRFNHLTQAKAVLVLCDTREKIYCWREAVMEPGIPEVFTRLRIRTWRTGETYREAGWTVTLPPSEESPDEPAEE